MAEDPFAILGLPRSYRIERAAVQRAYLERAANVHPDFARSAAGSAGPIDDAAASLNRAKETLENPELRAHTLLCLIAAEAGIPFQPADDRALPPGFLAQMMETREQIEADRAAGHTAKLAAWERWAEERRAAHQRKVGELFEPDAGRPTPASLRAIKMELNAWRYIERMIEQLDQPAD